MYHILIVEDDDKLNNGIRLALKGGEYVCSQCYSLGSAREEIAKKQPDLILLDVDLPDGKGTELLVEIRKKSDVPVIIITVHDMEADVVTGLEIGANDYIIKPFSLMVLRARVGVQLRQNSRKDIGLIQNDEFCFDFVKSEFWVKGVQVELSRTEQKLLRILTDNLGTTLSRGRLIDEIWSGDTEYVDEHALTVVIKRLRKKLGDSPVHPVHIKTVYGIGYLWMQN
jgi:DNA-binding response OmpR family regulator